MDHWINLYRASHSLEAHALKGALEVEGAGAAQWRGAVGRPG